MRLAMCVPTSSQRKPDYGLDAPPVIRSLLLIGGVAISVGLSLHFLGLSHPASIPLREIGLVVGLIFWLNAGGMVYYSKVGKLRARERFLDLIPWRGDEIVLDIGCGRGLLLVGAAKRLTTGKAVGVDLWQDADLSGNRPEATLLNALQEGVADRVEVKDGDARRLPFADASFDVVLSSLALHNIPDCDGRRQALREIARVLKPGGYIALVDIQHTSEYVRVLKECGLREVHRSASSWFTCLVTAFTWGGVEPYRVTACAPLQASHI
jgi:arsenite methyltransferase